MKKHNEAKHRPLYHAVLVQEQAEIIKTLKADKNRPRNAADGRDNLFGVAGALNMSKVHDYMAMTAACDLRPTSSFETDKWMAKLLAYVSKGKVKGATHSTVQDRVNALDARAQVEISALLLKLDSYSITTDAWTCVFPYVAFTFHGVDTTTDGDWKLMSGCLHVCELPGRHTGPALGAAVDDAVDRIADANGRPDPSGRAKTWAATADGAAAQRNAFTHLGDGFQLWTLWCTCHCLHLAVKDSMAQSETVLLTLKKMRRLAVAVRNSPLLGGELRAINAELGLITRRIILDVVTRWTSTAESVVHMVENRDALERLEDAAEAAAHAGEERSQKNTLLNAGYSDAEIERVLAGDELGSMTMTQLDWEIAVKISKALDICREASNVLSGDKYATMGLVLPVLQLSIDRLGDLDDEWQAEHDRAPRNSDLRKVLVASMDFAQRLANNIDERLSPTTFGEENHPYLVATFLHPSFNTFHFYNRENRVLALAAATKFLAIDMAEVQQEERVPPWAMAEKNLYAPEPVLPAVPAAAAAAAPVAAAAPAAAAAARRGDERHPKRQRVGNMYDGAWDGSDSDEDPGGGRVRPTIAQMIVKYKQHRFKRANRNNTQDPALLQELQRLQKADIDMTLIVRVALRYWHTPASSASTERLWSVGTNTLPKMRRGTTTANVSALINVNVNQDFITLE
jgi:hypothetical protein